MSIISRLALLFCLLVTACGSQELQCLTGTELTARGCELLNPIQCGTHQVLISNVCTSTVPPTECGFGVDPIWVGDRVICTDASPPVPVTNCGQGEIKVPQSNGTYVCVIDPTQQPIPVTCSPGTQLVGSRCEPIPAPVNAVVECSLTNNSSQQWTHAVFTPTQEVMGSFACGAMGKSAVMKLARFRLRAIDRRTGYPASTEKIGQIYLQDADRIVAMGSGVDGYGYVTLNFLPEYATTVSVGSYGSWDLVVGFERADNEIRYTFEHQSSSATVEARNADDQRPAEVRDSLYVWQGVPVVAVRAMPTIEFASPTQPSSVRDMSAFAGSVQIRNRSYWTDMNIYRITMCVRSSVRNQDYALRISGAGEYPYYVNVRASPKVRTSGAARKCRSGRRSVRPRCGRLRSLSTLVWLRLASVSRLVCRRTTSATPMDGEATITSPFRFSAPCTSRLPSSRSLTKSALARCAETFDSITRFRPAFREENFRLPRLISTSALAMT